MKHLLIVAASLLLGHAAWSAPVAPTYLKMVVTDNAGHGGTCQISRLAFFDAENGCVSVDLTQKDAGLAATELDANSFSPLLAYDGFDKPVSRIFSADDNKWCFSWTDHIKDSTVTLTMRLADTAQPVAYNFRSGGDDASFPDRAFSSWVLYGSADGVNWDVCDIVKNLPAVKANNAWYNGTIAEGANKGNFPIAMLTNEARGALTFKRGSLPGHEIPQVTLNAYGIGANSASVVLDWSKTDDFTDSITTAPVTLEGVAQLGVPVAMSVPDGLEAGVTYQVRARVTNEKSVETTFGPVTLAGIPDTKNYLMHADFKVAYDAGEEAMDDFRVLVRLAEGRPAGFTYEHCAADGSDLLFMSEDGSTAYFFDIDTWNPQGESCIWVRLPRAKKGDAFSMYYGKTGAAPLSDSEATWDGYVGVWHFAEASGTSYDATANNLDGVPTAAKSGNLAEMIGTDGVVGLARMNGTANGSERNRTAVPPYDKLMAGKSFTISGWFKANDVSGYPRLWSSKTGYNSSQGFEMELSSGSKTSASARGASQNAITVTFPDIMQNWLHLALVYDNTTLTAYVNGVKNISGTIAAVGPTTEPLSFGSNAPGTEACFNGKYDEIRLVEGAQSAKRIAAEYANMATDGFLSCTGISSTDPDMPNLASAAVVWKDDATTVSLVLKAGVGDAKVVFTDVQSGQVYTIELEKGLDAREEVKTVSYPLTAEQLPLGATYTWVVTVANEEFDHPAKVVGESKYYSGDADATVRYVSKTGSDENDGMLPSTAKATLQAAIDELGAEGGTVYIDDGDYVFTSESDAAVVITTPVKVIGLSRDPSKVTITRTGTPARNFLLNHEDCSLEFVTISGGTMRDDRGVSVSLRKGTVADCIICNADGQEWKCHGALYADGNTHVTRCIFRDNKGWFNGVALKAEGNAVIENCLFYNNINNGGAQNGGGTVLLGGWAKLVNCTIAGNSGKESTGVCASQYGNAVVQNCAIFGNAATSDTTGSGHIWRGRKDSFYYCASETAINDNCFALAPGFRDAPNNDYTLSSASELIDAGFAYSKTVATSETDLAGNAREVDNVDIGCYECTKTGFDIGFTASASEGLSPLSVTFAATVTGASGSLSYEWDFDNDGTVDETTDSATVTHVYTGTGRVSIGLTVKDEGGESRHAELLNAILISPKTVYVDVNNGDNAAYPYNSLETATPDLVTAIATAGNGSTVYVADGTYVAETANGFALDKNVRLLSISGKPEDCVIKEASVTSERRVLTVNHGSAIVAGFKVEGGYLGTSLGATLSFGALGGLVSNCVIRAGYVRDWGGDAALAYITPNGRVTHSILEDGLARDDYTTKNNRGKISSVYIAGQVDNCLIRNFNQQADNQNIVTVYNGGKLLNCTVVDGLCGQARDEDKTPCYGVRAEAGARIENCVIAGFRHVEEDESVTVRAWAGVADCFANCATDTAEPINDTCVTVTTAAFRDYAAKDYRPTSGSPLIGKGRKNELADGTDLIGNRRAVGPMDIGCYEAAQGMIIYVR